MTSKFPRDILVTTDFSESSYAAFPYALEYAKGSNSTLTLATVIGHPPLMVSFGTPHSQKEFDDLRIEAKLKATQKLKTLSLEFFGDIVTKQVVLDGFGWAADSIVEFASSVKSDLIVIATQGHGLAGRFFLGSVVERVLRQAKCAVLAVPSQPSGGTKKCENLPITKILITTDFSESSRAAFPIAVMEAARTKAKIILAHVVESEYAPELMKSLSEIIYSDQVQRLQNEYREGMEKKLRGLAVQLGAGEVTCCLIHKNYSISNSISEFIKEQGVNLLIVSSKGAGGRLNVLGGVIERTLRHSPCPILVAPSVGG